MTEFDELYQHINELQDDINRKTKELQYLHDFLSWENLWEEYAYFRMNAHLEHNENDPFSIYVL